jgi:hypothetical protein
MQVIRRHWSGDGRSRVTAHIHQFSPDGGAYNGGCEVEDLPHLKRLGCRMDETSANEKCRALEEREDARGHT